MARRGRRQPFPPIIKRLIQTQPASAAPVASKPFIVSLAAYRRPRLFPATIKTAIQYQPLPPIAGMPFIVGHVSKNFRVPRSFGAKTATAVQYQPLPPIAAKPLVVSFASRLAAMRVKTRSFQQGLIRYQPAPHADPVPRTAYIVSRISVDQARRRLRTLHKTSLAPPSVVIPVVITVSPRFLFHHDERATSDRTRKFEQQSSEFFNNLLRTGELRGTPLDPSLGYTPTSGADWGPGLPEAVRDALDRIAKAIKEIRGIGP